MSNKAMAWLSCLERGATDLHMCPGDATATPSSLALLKYRMVEPFCGVPAYPGR